MTHRYAIVNANRLLACCQGGGECAAAGARHYGGPKNGADVAQRRVRQPHAQAGARAAACQTRRSCAAEKEG